MTIEERYALSCYEELTKLDDVKDVWLVRHNETGTLYVKKRMQLYNRAIYQRLSECHIPNVPKVVLCVEDEAGLIVVEEYIHGMTLEQQLEQDGVLSETKVAEIMIKLCDTLQLLHGSTPPVIHRDIKPSNIMISSEGTVKLIDFNAAKEFTPGQSEDTRLMGTRKFAAPEQYGFGQSDQRTDIYALGVTMYYLLTKHFPESNLYHGYLFPVIEKCMNIDKERRYPDVLTLKSAISDASMGTTGQSSREASSEMKVTSFMRPLYGYKEWFPVGFRSGVLWKMLLAIAGYLFTVWLSCTAIVKNADGIALTGYPLAVNRVAIFLILLGTIFFLGNYCDIRYRLPFMKRNKILHWILSAVYLILYYALIIVLLIIIGG
ncbi:MAG: serine/threonine protein kinase [Wujia sp.]